LLGVCDDKLFKRLKIFLQLVVCLTRKLRILSVVLVGVLLCLTFAVPMRVGASDNETLLAKISKLQDDVDRIFDLVSMMSVSSTQNLAGEIDNVRAKILDLQDQVVALQRAVGEVSGASPSVVESLADLSSRLDDLGKKVDTLVPSTSPWNMTTPWGPGGQSQMGMLAMTISPQKPKKGDFFTIMVYDMTTNQPAAGAMVQGPGLFMLTGFSGGMIPLIGGNMPSFGFAIADAYGVVYGRWEGGKATYTARSQSGRFGSLTVGGAGSALAWLLAILITVAFVLSGVYVYYRRELGFGGMSV